MNHAERVVLSIIGAIGTAIIGYMGYYAFAGAFLMVLAFIGEGIDVIVRRLDKIVTTLEASKRRHSN